MMMRKPITTGAISQPPILLDVSPKPISHHITNQLKERGEIRRNLFPWISECAFNPTQNPIKRMRTMLVIILDYREDDSWGKHHNHFSNKVLLRALKLPSSNPPRCSFANSFPIHQVSCFASSIPSHSKSLISFFRLLHTEHEL